MLQLIDTLLASPRIHSDAIARELVPVLVRSTGRSSAGYPYLDEPAWRRFRDWVPHILGHGPRVLEAVETVHATARDCGASSEHLSLIETSSSVVRQVVMTAAITAPPDLYVIRWVVAGLHEVGLVDRLLDGEVVHPGDAGQVLEAEILIDLRFLLSRGYLARFGHDGVRIRDHERARRLFTDLPLADAAGPGAVELWTRALTDTLTGDDRAALLGQTAPDPGPVDFGGTWSATPEEVLLGARLVPLVLALRAHGSIPRLLESETMLEVLEGNDPALEETARGLFHAAGLIDDENRSTSVGHRVLTRGPGPFGIIAAYHPYFASLPEILREGRGRVHVRRGANILASQDANRGTFQKANDALDRFLDETGHRLGVFIEHALGRGEATRQRWARSGDDVAYVGADLEDAAVDAAAAERERGALPGDMLLLRDMDIGRPEKLVQALRDAGLEPEGAVMMVGNGFHEIRDQSDAHMKEVFRTYHDAGILLIFTEESALSTDILLETAWNTYHAGFKYVHARSGQGLRPALPSPPQPLEGPLPASWTECAQEAGYFRGDVWSSRGRTVFPATPATGHNPAISVNHFFVPCPIARRLGLWPKESRT